MRVLVTNDDGIDAPGLTSLAAALHEAGYDVVAVAPDRNCSGWGAAIGDVGSGAVPEIRTIRTTLPGLEQVPAWAIDGPPALCVLAARLGGFGDPPDLVASGVNPGNNTGRAVLHSGTVGAALTGANMGVSGVAVSVADAPHPQYATASTVAVAALDWLAAAEVGTVLNVNVPDLPLEDVRGTRWAELAPFGTVRAAISAIDEHRLSVGIVRTEAELPPDSDSALVRAGYVAVTSLTRIRVAEWQPAAAEIDRRLAARDASGRAPVVAPVPGETA